MGTTLKPGAGEIKNPGVEQNPANKIQESRKCLSPEDLQFLERTPELRQQQIVSGDRSNAVNLTQSEGSTHVAENAIGNPALLPTSAPGTRGSHSEDDEDQEERSKYAPG